MSEGSYPPPTINDDDDDDDDTLSSESDDGEDQFQTLCDGFETGVNFCAESFSHVIKLKNELMKHNLPVNTLRQVTLSLAKLQRSFIDMSQQGTELIRLVRVYSTPWKDKTRSLKALHKDYNNKQKKLDIAMQKFEMLASRNKMLEGDKVVMNWEKLYMALHSTRCDGLGWKYVVQLLKKKKAEGGTMQDLLRVLEEQEKATGSKPRTRQRPRGAGRGFNMSAALEAKDAAFDAVPSEGGDSLNVSVSLNSDDDGDVSIGSDTVSLGLPLSDGGKAESSVFEWMSRISGRQPDEEGTLMPEEVSNSRTGVSMGSWHTRIPEEDTEPPYDPSDPAYPPDIVYHHEEHARSSAKGSSSVHEIATTSLPPPVATAIEMVDTSTWTGDVEYDHYLIMRLSPPTCPYLTKPWCTVAIDGQIMKTDVFHTGDSDTEGEEEGETYPVAKDASQFEEVLFKLDVDNDNIRTSNMFSSAGVVRIAVHPDLNKSMVAMTTTKLSTISKNEEHTVDLVENVEALPLEETELNLTSTIDKEEIRFNQQCGSIRILCAFVRCPRLEKADVGTETIALEDLINDMLEQSREKQRRERCRSACEQTEMDVYTQSDMDEYKMELKKELEQLNAQYEQRLSGIIGDATDTVRQYIDITTTPLLADQIQGSKPASPTPSAALLQEGVEWHPPPPQLLPADVYAAYERQNLSTKQPAWRPVGNSSSSFPAPPTPAPPSERGGIWGKDLPEDFFQRLSLFTESSERYQQALRKKLKMETEKELGTKLKALKKYKSQENGKEGSIYAERIVLPALFAPIKRHMGTGGAPTSRGRSFLNGLGVSTEAQLPAVKPPAVSKRDIERYLESKAWFTYT